MSVPDPGLEVDVSKIEEATEALHTLAHAAQMALQALQDLGMTLCDMADDLDTDDDGEPLDG